MPLIRAMMGMISVLALVVFLFFTCWILAAGCSRAHVLVRNQSGCTISNLVISGSCKERRSYTLATDSEWQTVTPYQSGGLIQFSFVSASSNYVVHPNTGTNLSGSCGIFFRVASNMLVTS